MARLPTLDSLGARPAPRSQRGVSSVRNAGAVGDAVSELGANVAGIGQQMMQREDKLSYAAAKTAVLRADVNAREELRDDPDYGTYEKRYQERMAAARATASSLIQSKTDRRLFDVDVQLDLDRGAGEIRKLANDKRRAARVDVLSSGLDNTLAIGRSALDDATRETTIATAQDLIHGAIEGGDIDPIKGAELRRNWTSSYANEQVALAIDRGELDKARGMLGKFGGYMSSDDYLRLNAALDNETDSKAVLGAADVAVGSAPTLSSSNAPTTLKMPVIGKVTSGIGQRIPPIAGASSEHNGIDLAVPVGTAVAAPAPGKVVKVWTDDRGGKQIVIDHGNGVTTGYAHLSEQDVKVGDTVDTGQTFAKSGATGNVTGPHLHWTARVAGKVVDPRTVNVAAGSGRFDTVEDAVTRGIAALGPNATTKQVKELRQEVATRFQMREAAEKDNEEAVIEGVQSALIKNGGNWYGLPASVRQSVNPKYVPGLINFGEGLKPTAPARKTDPATYIKMSDLATTNPHGFAAINPIEYRASMDDGDWNRMVAQRSAILGGKTAAPEQVTVSRIRSATAAAMAAQGLDAAGKTGSTRQEVERRRYGFEKAMLRDVAVLQETNGGKAPDEATIQKLADTLLLKHGKEFVFEMDDVEIGKRMNDKDRARSIAALSAARLPTTEANIVTVYRRALAQGGFAPGGGN